MYVCLFDLAQEPARQIVTLSGNDPISDEVAKSFGTYRATTQMLNDRHVWKKVTADDFINTPGNIFLTALTHGHSILLNLMNEF